MSAAEEVVISNQLATNNNAPIPEEEKGSKCEQSNPRNPWVDSQRFVYALWDIPRLTTEVKAKWFKPTTVEEVKSCVSVALKEGAGIVPVGALHSFDRLLDVNHHNMIVLDMHSSAVDELTRENLNFIGRENNLIQDKIRIQRTITSLISSNDDRCAPATPRRQFDENPEHYVVRVGAAVPLQNLNDWLDSKGLALSNLGQVTQQSISGAASTGTHGSGILLAPISNYVAAIEIVCVRNINNAAVMQRVRFESASFPITEYSTLEGFDAVIRDDDVFHAARVSLGTAGIITAVVLAVQDKMFLKEVRHLCALDDALKNLPELLYSNRHVEILLNPYDKPSKKKTALLITRNIVPDGPADWEQTHRNVFYESLHKHGEEFGAAQNVFAQIFEQSCCGKLSGKTASDVLRMQLETMQDESGFVAPSKDSLLSGAPPQFIVFSAESCVPITADEFNNRNGDGNQCNYVKAIRSACDFLQTRAKDRIWMNTPLNIRFAWRSDDFLAPTYSDKNKSNIVAFCFIEQPMHPGLEEHDPFMYQTIKDLESHLVNDFHSQPHFAKVHNRKVGQSPVYYHLQKVRPNALQGLQKGMRAIYNLQPGQTPSSIHGLNIFYQNPFVLDWELDKIYQE